MSKSRSKNIDSSMILDYCYKYGQNRELEKYLRLRKNNSSSSEISLNYILEAEKEHAQSEGNACQASFEPVTLRNTYSEKQVEAQVKAFLSIANDTDRLSTAAKGQASSYSTVNRLSSALTIDTLPECSSTEPDTAIADFNDSKRLNKTNAKSLDVSTISNKRLEWDSLGDVGYKKSKSTTDIPCSISSLERNVLRHFFLDRGVDINFKKAEEKILEKSQHKPTKSNTKEKWRETLETVKKKYGLPTKSMGSNIMNFAEIASQLHSTPKAMTPTDNSLALQRFEKNCQTRYIQTENKEIQAQLSAINSSRSGIDCDLVSLSSFEYISQPSSNKSDKENVSPQSVLEQDNILRSHPPPDAISLSSNNGNESELKLGIKLLCSLIEAKNLNEKQKVTLAKKLVAKITKRTSHISSVSCGSTISSISNDAIITSNSSETKPSTIKFSKRRNVTPMSANSESAPKNIVKLKSIENMEEITRKSLKNDNKNIVENIKNSVLGEQPQCEHKSGKSDEYDEVSNKSCEKVGLNNETIINNETLTSEKATMQEWLEPLTYSEITYNNIRDKENHNSRKATGSNVFQYIENERKTHLVWIENEIKHLENLKLLLVENKMNLNTEIQIDGLPHNSVKIPNVYDKVASTSKSSDSSSLRSQKEDMKEPKIKIHSEVQKLHKKGIAENSEQHKLTEGEPIHDNKFTFVRKKSTINKSDKMSTDRSKLETPKSQSGESIRSFARQRKKNFLETYQKSKTAIYNQPIETDHYSVPREVNKRKFSKADAYTSVTSSDFFISSASMSVPEANSISTTTTTHQYDDRFAIGVQTNDSLFKTSPIFGSKKCYCGESCQCLPQKPTIRVYRSGNSKQTQMKPESIAYVITFDNTKSKPDSSTNLTLKDHLKLNRPTFCEKAAHRQTVLNKLNELRQERQEKIEDIIENTSLRSVARKLKSLPPHPIKYTGICSGKEMRALTKKKCSNLAEVVRKAEKEKLEKRKKSNKILADMFNRRLQRRVRTGKLSLDHCRTVV